MDRKDNYTIMIKVILSEPSLREALEKKELELDLKDGSKFKVGDVLETLEERYSDRGVKKILKDKNGNYKPFFITVINGKSYLLRNTLNYKLKDGDSIRFLGILSGG